MEQDLIQRINDIVTANIGNPKFGVDELAHAVGMSHSSLFRRVQNLTGKSVSQLMHEIRMNVALDLLQTSHLNISEVAFRVGFNSASYFSTSFHNHFGYSPGEARRPAPNDGGKSAGTRLVSGKPGALIHRTLRSLSGRKTRTGVILSLVLVALILPGWILISNTFHATWARNRGIPEVQKLLEGGHSLAAFELLNKVLPYVKEDSRIDRILYEYSSKMGLYSEPVGARVYVKRIFRDVTDWIYLGTTPNDSTLVPRETLVAYMMVKAGYDTAFGIHWLPEVGRKLPLYRKLLPVGETPAGMVYIYQPGNDTTSNFFIDRYEVTNKQFREFINQGGYQKKQYWKFPFIEGDDTLSWEEGMAHFHDKSSRPGPSAWSASMYPEGQDNFPVNGVSWYEAAAYAEFAGMELPTLIHWKMASQDNEFTKSNFNQKGPMAVGSFQVPNKYGAYDMAGNVREWVFNESENGRVIIGAAWDDPTYQSYTPSYIPALDRSEKNGFRCARYVMRSKIWPGCFEKKTLFAEQPVDFYKLKPVSDKEFAIIKRFYDFDRGKLDTVVLERDTTPPEWVTEKVEFNGAYDNTRMQAYLFTPKHARPPFKTIICVPDITAHESDSSIRIARNVPLRFLLENGRAVMAPVFWGTYEKRIPEEANLGALTFRDNEIRFAKDFRRSIDYLQSRPDIDHRDFAYFGASWGGRLAPILGAVEDRITAIIIALSGFVYFPKNPAEIQQINFITRVRAPTIIFAGRLDMHYPYDLFVVPFRDLLGTPTRDKYLKTYDTDHSIPPNAMIEETLRFLDRYFGVVRQ